MVLDFSASDSSRCSMENKTRYLVYSRRDESEWKNHASSHHNLAMYDENVLSPTVAAAKESYS